MFSNRHSASFRDPAGYIFTLAQEVYRQINPDGKEAYCLLMKSGLYDDLVSSNRLVSHEEVTEGPAWSETGTVIKPLQIPHISYPYEWSFSQLQDAALLTLDICSAAMKHGMILKDASAFNVQFYHGKPIFIDTGSFQQYKEGAAWEGYRQFCQHFLAPLLLAARIDINFIAAQKAFIDGIPLDLASKLLPRRSWLSWGILSNIHLHARAQSRYSDKTGKQTRTPRISRNGLMGMLDGLSRLVRKLEWKPEGTEWGDYYSFTNYSDDATKEKLILVEKMTARVGAGRVWDLGGNIGVYSRAAMAAGGDVVCWDIDPAAVERNYLQTKQEQDEFILPLLQDLTNPSPGLGWAHHERNSLQQRGPVNLVLALALIHHIAISNNVPLEQVAEYLSTLGHFLLIEFVPKEDSQVEKLLATRQDIFENYNLEGFTAAFEQYFTEIDRTKIEGTVRTLVLYQRKTLHS